MLTMPGEQLVTIEVPGAWAEGDETDAEAVLMAAVYFVCRHVIHLSPSDGAARRFAVALTGSVPAVLDLTIMLAFGEPELRLRVPKTAEEAGRILLSRIRDQAVAMAPRTRAVSYELPF